MCELIFKLKEDSPHLPRQQNLLFTTFWDKYADLDANFYLNMQWFRYFYICIQIRICIIMRILQIFFWVKFAHADVNSWLTLFKEEFAHAF